MRRTIEYALASLVFLAMMAIGVFELGQLAVWALDAFLYHQFK